MLRAREQDQVPGWCTLRTAARHQGSTSVHVHSTEMKAYRLLCSLPYRSSGLILAMRCPEGEGTQWHEISGYLVRRREMWPRCTACRDLRGPTAWTSRVYFWRGFKCLDTTSNPERKKGVSMNTFLCPSLARLQITSHSFSAGTVCHPFFLFFSYLRVGLVELWMFPPKHTFGFFTQVTCGFKMPHDAKNNRFPAMFQRWSTPPPIITSFQIFSKLHCPIMTGAGRRGLF